MKNYYKKGVEAMAIKEFEFMHGGVITRLLRKDIPLQMTLVETSSNDSKAVYKILSQNNRELTLYIKYRSRPEPRKKEGNTWFFNFTQKNLNELSLYKDGNFMIALVCGNDDKLNDSEVCLLDKQQVISCINIESESNQTITVKLMGNKSFRAYGTMTTGDPLIIPRNRINTISI
jgi:hypothetical protein